MKNKLKALASPAVALLAYVLVFILSPQTFRTALVFISGFLKEMIQVLPRVLILSGLIAVWVPRDVIIGGFGNKSGWKGRLLSLLIGSVSAGPIYAAFPLCLTFKKKGASTENIIIILSSWAVIKVPMLIMEIKFLGMEFSLLRYLLTVPVIFLMAWILKKILAWDELDSTALGASAPLHPRDLVLEKLPGYNCKSCGHDNCADFSEAAALGLSPLSKCEFAK